MMHDACHTDDGFTSADNGDLSWLAAERSRAAGHAGKSGSLLEHEHEHEHELSGAAAIDNSEEAPAYTHGEGAPVEVGPNGYAVSNCVI